MYLRKKAAEQIGELVVKFITKFKHYKVAICKIPNANNGLYGRDVNNKEINEYNKKINNIADQLMIIYHCFCSYHFRKFFIYNHLNYQNYFLQNPLMLSKSNKNALINVLKKKSLSLNKLMHFFFQSNRVASIKKDICFKLFKLPKEIRRRT